MGGPPSFPPLDSAPPAPTPAGPGAPPLAAAPGAASGDPKQVERGKGAIAKALARLPEAKRTAVEAVLADPEFGEALDELGGDGLRQDEFSRKMGEVEEAKQTNLRYRGQLDGWWKDKTD